MKMRIVPIFKNIFPDEPQPEIKTLIKNIPTEAIIRICCLINAKLHFPKDRLKSEIQIFIQLIERIQDDKIRNAPYLRLLEFQKKMIDHDLAIFPLPHTLKLIDEAYLSTYIPLYGRTTPEQDLDILKLLLLFNSDINEKASTIFRSIDISSDHSAYKTFWSSLLPNSTVLLPKDLIFSVYKSVCFLKFLSLKSARYLEEYVNINKVDHFLRIPIKFFELYSNGYNRSADIFCWYFESEIIKVNPLIESLTLDVANSSRDEYLRKRFNINFKGLRTFPFRKLKENEYHISNWNFIVEKFYEGLVFDFFQKTDIKKEKRMSTFENYKSWIGDEFSNAFFMELMEDIFGTLPVIHYKEKQFNAKCDYDYYLRIGKNVFFFEFKDVLFPLKETYEDIKETLDTKLISNDKGKEKGIGQLIRHIRAFNANSEMYDDLKSEGVSVEDIIIYPILVYSDHAFGMTGVNHYLNSMFVSEIVKEHLKLKVKPLVMISLDFFMEEQSNLISGKVDLVQIMNLYFKTKAKNEEAFLNDKNPDSYQNKYEGFEVTIREILISYSKDSIDSVFMERIMNEFKPLLQKE